MLARPRISEDEGKATERGEALSHPFAAQVVAEGLRENLRLTHLDVSGNPVGSLGGRALLACLNYARRPRTVELGGCELGGDDREPGRFDASGPARRSHYTFNVSDESHDGSSCTLRDLDERGAAVQKSAETTSM